MRLPTIALACTAAIVSLQSAQAGTASTSFSVTITVTKECSITAPATINFGSVGAATLMTGLTQQTQTFTVLCATGTPYTIAFSSPNDLVTNAVTHQMKGTGSNTGVIQYTLNDATSGALNLLPLGGALSVIAGIGTGSTQTKSLQASILTPLIAVTPDTYLDTVTMAITY